MRQPTCKVFRLGETVTSDTRTEQHASPAVQQASANASPVRLPLRFRAVPVPGSLCRSGDRQVDARATWLNGRFHDFERQLRSGVTVNSGSGPGVRAHEPGGGSAITFRHSKIEVGGLVAARYGRSSLLIASVARVHGTESSLSKVFDNARPECQQFTRYWTVVTCSRVNHHELRFRFHENELHPQTP